MLQQTRVEAVIPYYHRFLERFPTVASLAAAPETDVLTAWSGLGYYSRARNLHRAAKKIAAEGSPQTHAGVLDLPGAGPYTAAAISSIALNLPHAAVDGNVMRVISRLTNDASDIGSTIARRKFAVEAEALLDTRRPGDFNQAMMELGATICLPRTPDCHSCPVSKFCSARSAGAERELPVKLKKQAARDVPIDLLLIRSADDNRVFLIRRSSSEKRLADFWELPERDRLPRLIKPRRLGEFRHQIVNDRFCVRLWAAHAKHADLPPGKWFAPPEWSGIPLTTITKKALALAMP
jgi:A/G-specific adenine glycosylase